MNKDNYKKAIDQIHPSDNLKRKTLEKMLEYRKKRKKEYMYMNFAVSCVIVILVCFVGQNYIKKTTKEQIKQLADNVKIEKIKNDLPRFKSMQQLKNVLVEIDAYREAEYNNEKVFSSSLKNDLSESIPAVQNKYNEKSDFSTTNVQVENVDEADIVKTDGKYIYYVTNNKILIIKADTLEIVSTIDENINVEKSNRNLFVHEIFINENFLIALGNQFYYETTKTRTVSTGLEEKISEDFISIDRANINTSRVAKAIVYDISDRKNPKIKREIDLEGYYTNSRMIGDYVYFISTKNGYYASYMKDEEILPFYKDSNVTTKNITIPYSDIAYFEGTNNQNFTLIAGFDIKNQEEIFLETFMGASQTIYASEKNLYLAQVIYNEENYRLEKSTIYKFNLNKGQIILQCKGDVIGNLNNQFSMDEYEGNLRIATTAYNEENESTNQLYILDKDLKQIGKIEDLAKGEKIYAVRFIGKIGYVVTFKEIDPLFVIDLSNPTNPTVKGKLKIPGYSSYLHPYDETHIIGIGYNTKSNGYGGVTNDNMKMSMFDVSDLENPREMFNIDIGNSYVYSQITYNHKALFYHKEKNLIGFPVTMREYYASKDTDNFILYKIDLENGFEEYGRISQKINYKTNINRAIYIRNALYTLSESQIISYDLDTMMKQNEVEYSNKY